MATTNDVITSQAGYESALKQGRIVFTLFVSKSCPACEYYRPFFESAAKEHDRFVDSYVIEPTVAPELGKPERRSTEKVTGTPTLVTHIDGEVQEVIRGFVDEKTLTQELNDIFSRYA
ncbi:thioredoxin family protein [Pseudomonas sp. R76]|uniref:thioredoxin family protein n=1 Tax=Pseudomonas sp. R76 TaxID=1573711 RepID=UPI0013202562|nr:thioredoxin family protein [Pseudomonas sp. R76]QHD07611.1 hypothetical protein PspR76_18555 [Pseudomonas sp. R76]